MVTSVIINQKWNKSNKSTHRIVVEYYTHDESDYATSHSEFNCDIQEFLKNLQGFGCTVNSYINT